MAGLDPFRKTDRPKRGIHVIKRKSDHMASLGVALHAHYSASYLFSVPRIHENNPLVHCHSEGRHQSPTVGIYGHCESVCLEMFRAGNLRPYQNIQTQHDPLAATSVLGVKLRGWRLDNDCLPQSKVFKERPDRLGLELVAFVKHNNFVFGQNALVNYVDSVFFRSYEGAAKRNPKRSQHPKRFHKLIVAYGIGTRRHWPD